jgi:hypothetical protein
MRGQNQPGRNRHAKSEKRTFKVQGWQRQYPSGERTPMEERIFKLIYATSHDAMHAYAKQFKIPATAFLNGASPDVVIRVEELGLE